MKYLRTSVCTVALILCGVENVSAVGVSPLDIRLSDSETGATCEYFNIGAKLAWNNKGGDWMDSGGTAQGSRPFAATTHGTHPSEKVVWDVSGLVSFKAPGNYRYSFLVRQLPTSPRGGAEFHSRETSDPLLRPNLLLTFSDGSRDLLTPSADATLDCSARWGIGTRPTLQVSDWQNFILEFSPDSSASKKILRNAKLVLVTTARNSSESLLGVYRLGIPGFEPESQISKDGIAAHYPSDSGLERDKEVIFVERFESANWLRNWTYAADTKSFETIEGDPERRFEPVQGKALRVTVRKGELTGLQMGFNFKPQTGQEPEEIYFRYYLRLGNDFNPIEGGKLPGPSGTYDRAGWGGRQPDGTNGWSARGAWDLPAGKGNPFAGFFPLATQISVPNISEDKANIYWMKGRRGLLERNRWYCIEHYVRMNTPGKADGVLRGWVDGYLAVERTYIRYRDVASLKIDRIWMNVYHGGMTPPTQDIHLYLDNVVIARSYIGPMRNR